MTIRIYQEAKGAMQSGRGRVGRWVLENEAEKASQPTGLMGWSGGAETSRQVKLYFASQEAAVAHAVSLGQPYQLLAGTSQRKIKPKAYADNFSFQKLQPWTH